MAKKARKYFTLIVVPDAQAQFKQIKVPYFLTKVLIALVILSILSIPPLLHYLYRSYQDMEQHSRELPVIRQETKNQRTLIERYEGDITELHQMVSRLKLVNAKLMLMAGVENPADAQFSFSAGGDSEINEFLSIVERSYKQTEEAMRQKLNVLEDLKRIATDQEQLGERLMEYFQDQKTVLASTPSIWPTRGWITSGFGMRKSPFTGTRSMHSGIDIATKSGSPIVAPADGIVSFSGTKGSFGRVLVLDHGYDYVTFYAHCSKLAKDVGDKVKRGDVVAYVGNSGRSTGPHLHYEVRVSGVATNPIKYILDF